MTYHPKPLMLTSLFLATKTENHYTRLTSFASRIPGKKPTTPEDVIAPEFLLTQGLRFTFEVRHPFRGLEGGVMGLLGMVGKEGGLPGLEGGDIRERIHLAHSKAKNLLKTSALLTDAYFLATPSQLWLAALLAADRPLALFLLSTITPSSTHEGSLGKEPLNTNTKLLDHLTSISQLLLSPPAHTTDMEEARRVDKKVYFCRNPEKVDFKMLGKRGSESEDGGRKRRKREDNGDGDGGVFG
jgi:cyclin H